MFLYRHQEVEFPAVEAVVIEAVDVDVTTDKQTVALYDSIDTLINKKPTIRWD